MDKEEIKEEASGNKKLFRPIQIIIPIIIGIGVVAWMFAKDVSQFDWSSLRITWHVVLALFIMLICVVGREIGYMWRFRILTDRALSWRQAFKVTMLCEFSSTITPSAVGGSSLGMVFMRREGISWGRGTTIVLITLFLDELFFVISCPLAVAFTPFGELFSSGSEAFTDGIQWAFWSVYILIAMWTAVLFVGILIKPQFIRGLLNGIFKLRILHKWQQSVSELGDSIVDASCEVKQKGLLWWGKTFGATAMSWISRYLTVNALFLAFVVGADQLIVFARQVVVWLMLMVTPTPGGSGVSEWLFTEYYGDMVNVAGLALMIALMWRIVSYYLYLVVGVIIIPSWVRGWKKNKK